MTQSTLSQLTGLAQGTISDWERGAVRKRFSPAIVKALAAALGVREEWLLAGAGERVISPAQGISGLRAAPSVARRAEALARLRAAVEEVEALCKDGSPGEAGGRPDQAADG